MDMDLIFGVMVICLQENGKMTYEMDSEKWSIVMVKLTKVNGKMILNMVMDNTIGVLTNHL